MVLITASYTMSQTSVHSSSGYVAATATIQKSDDSLWCGVCVLSHVRLFVAPWTVDHQAPLSMGFFRQERWSECPFPPPWDLPDPESNSHL